MKKIILFISISFALISASIIYSEYNNRKENIETSLITNEQNYVIKDNTEIIGEEEIKTNNNYNKNITEQNTTENEFVFPASGEIIKNYNNNELEFSAEYNDYRTHNGIDIATENAKVICIADGYVDDVYQEVSGNYIIKILHENNMISLYKNIIPNSDIKAGKEIKKGTPLGNGDFNSDNVKYIHFELKIDGKTIDPTEIFN